MHRPAPGSSRAELSFRPRSPWLRLGWWPPRLPWATYLPTLPRRGNLSRLPLAGRGAQLDDASFCPSGLRALELPCKPSLPAPSRRCLPAWLACVLLLQRLPLRASQHQAAPTRNRCCCCCCFCCAGWQQSSGAAAGAEVPPPGFAKAKRAAAGSGKVALPQRRLVALDWLYYWAAARLMVREWEWEGGGGRACPASRWWPSLPGRGLRLSAWWPLSAASLLPSSQTQSAGDGKGCRVE